MSNEKNITFYDFYRALHTKWRVFPISFLVCTTLAVIMSFVMKETFYSEATILTTSSSGSSLGRLLSGASSILETLDLSGSMGGGASEHILDILESKTVAGGVIEKLGIKKDLVPQYWDEKNQTWNESLKLVDEDAFREFHDRLSLDQTDSGMIRVGFEFISAESAAQIVNEILTQTDNFLANNTLTVVKRNRVFLGEQLARAEKDLKNVEDSLNAFQKKNGLVEPVTQAQASLGILNDLQFALSDIDYRIKMESAINNSESNPNLNRLFSEKEARLRQIKNLWDPSSTKQNGKGGNSSVSLSKVPDLMTEYARLQRDLHVQQAIYQLLVQQYEVAKIEEVKNDVRFQTVDKAVPPAKRLRPKRLLNVIIAAVFSVMFALIFIYFQEYYLNMNRKKKLPWQVINIAK